jgi:hypothetical protein
MVGLLIALIAVIVIRVRRQDIRWRRAAIVGLIGMVLSFLSSLNEFPLAEYGYPTTDAYPSFLIQKLLQALLGALAWGGALFVITPPARRCCIAKLSPIKCRWETCSAAADCAASASSSAPFWAWLCAPSSWPTRRVFYIVANRLGAWSPADVPYSDLLNTKFPGSMCWWAGTCRRSPRSSCSACSPFRFCEALRWLPAAIVVAGFVWGFGHAGYPNQPFYIRGVEVGIGGVALGLIMLRWGILPTLIWHYSVDAMYSALLLLRSHSLYFRLSGAASAGIFVVPIAIALVAYWRHGGFEPATGLLNGDEPAAPEPPPEPALRPSTFWTLRPLSRRMRLAALAIFVAGLATALIPIAHFGDSPQ